jgi:hypothetical protein
MLLRLCVLLGLCTSTIQAQEVPAKPPEAPKFEEYTVRTIAITPQNLPFLPSKVRLTYAPEELVTGNAALHYQRANSILRTFVDRISERFVSAEARQRFFATEEVELAEWLRKPFDPTAANMPRFKAMMQERISVDVLKEIRRAATSSYCDWGVERVIAEDQFHASLTDVMQSRAHARMICFQLRLYILDGKIDEAIGCYRDGLMLARHCSQGNTLVHLLMSVAIQLQFLLDMEILHTMPNGPNLHGALLALAPLQDRRAIIEGEQRGIKSLIKSLHAVENKVLTELQASEVLKETVRTLQESLPGASLPKEGLIAKVTEQLGAVLLAGSVHKEASQAILKKAGKTPAELVSMPMLQQYLLAEYLQMQTLMEETVLAFQAPFPEATIRMADMEKGPLKVMANAGPANPLRELFALSIPAYQRSLTLPEKLEDIRLYVPADPITGRWPKFEFKKDTITLTYENTTGAPQDGLRYIITLKAQ